MEVLKCKKCGEEIHFYQNIKLNAKMKICKNGWKIAPGIYDIDKVLIEDPDTRIYCGNCNNLIRR